MSHSHTHAHSSVKNIKLVFFLNLGFTLVEFVGGFLTNSTAILADAVHDLGDSFALGQAWYFGSLAQRKGDNRYTYGFKRFATLGALISTFVLLLSSFYVLSEAVPRIIEPEHSNAQGMIVLAVIGIAVNGYAMLKLAGESDINARTVGLHLLEDVLGWVAILIVAVILLFKDIPVLDPILAVLITLYILSNVVKNVRAILPIFLQAAPDKIDVNIISARIVEIEHVQNVHHVHIWSLDDQHQVFSVHIVVDTSLDAQQYADIKLKVKELVEELGFSHSTVEIELPDESCRISEHEHCA